MGNYSESTGNLLGQGDVALYWRCWTVPEPQGIVVLVHGLGEHCGRYSNIINRLAGEQVSFYSLDHRGHGKSQGPRGHLEKFDYFIQDLKLVVDMAHQQNPGVPLIMLGHSMGGAIAGRYALTYPQDIDALILSAAGIIPGTSLPAWQDILLKVLSRIAPGASFPNGLSADDLSHDLAVVKAYNDDPLVHNKISARWYTEILANSQEILQRASELTMPLLVMHGGGDKIVSITGSEQVYNAARAADKQYKVFPGLYHETMNEKQPEQGEVLDVVAQWILSHIEK
ncbi:MAG: lysophospholipase [Methanomassiliicoccales archaeon]